MVPKHSTEMLSNFTNHKHDVIMEKVHVLDTLHLGIHCSSIGSEFNVNESTKF
jgi:hypothetical protein